MLSHEIVPVEFKRFQLDLIIKCLDKTLDEDGWDIQMDVDTQNEYDNLMDIIFKLERV